MEEKATCIAILRGINVSGKNMIKMPALVKSFESMPFEDVRTYLQSGNVLFRSKDKDYADLQKKIKKLIETDFGLDVPVIVFNSEYLSKVQESNPFASKTDDHTKLHVTFLSEKPDESNLAKINPELYRPDEFSMDQEVIFLYCPGGYGNTKLNNNFFEKKLKVSATTRNWNTVNQLVELSR